MGFLSEMKAQKALMAHGKGRSEEAFAVYQELYEKGELTNPRYLLPYSILLLRKGEYAKAQEVLKKAEKAGGLSQDQRCQLLTNYAVASWKLGRLDYALELLQEVFRKGANGAIYNTLGYMLIEKGDFEEALAFNKEAVDYDDEDGVSLDNLAQTYYRLGNDKQEARKWFEKAIEFRPQAIDTNYFLALYDIEDGNYEQAREHLETAREGRMSPLNYATHERIDEAMARLPEA